MPFFKQKLAYKLYTDGVNLNLIAKQLKIKPSSAYAYISCCNAAVKVNKIPRKPRPHNIFGYNIEICYIKLQTNNISGVYFCLDTINCVKYLQLTKQLYNI